MRCLHTVIPQSGWPGSCTLLHSKACPPAHTQMLSSTARKGQGATDPFVMPIGLPAASTYCATTVASCLSKQFLTATVAFPVVAAPAPLLQTHAAPLVAGQANWLLFLAGALVHVQPAVLACGFSEAQVAALAPVCAKLAVIKSTIVAAGLAVGCRVSHVMSPQRHGRLTQTACRLLSWRQACLEALRLKAPATRATPLLQLARQHYPRCGAAAWPMRASAQSAVWSTPARLVTCIPASSC
jgi:hypothetical protein